MEKGFNQENCQYKSMKLLEIKINSREKFEKVENNFV